MNLNTAVPLIYNTFFTKRELEVLKLISDGCNSKQIAMHLAIAVDTVKKHRQNILKKADGKNTMHIVKNSLIQGVI